MINPEQMARLGIDADQWGAPINNACAEFAIDEPPRVAMFLATCLYESAGLTRLVENLNYSAQALCRVWPNRFNPNGAAQYAHQPERIANYVYANRGGNGDAASGDGWRYRGRGPIQITLRDNYTAAAVALGLPLIEQPELMERPDVGMRAAGWIWKASRCNDIADNGDFAGTQGAINRGNKFATADNMPGRLAWFDRVRGVVPL